MKQLKPNKSVRISPAGDDRKPIIAPVEGTVESVKMAGRQCLVTVTLARPSSNFLPTGLVRLWAN